MIDAIPQDAQQADSMAPDATARATIDRYAHRLAKALASVIDVVDPDIVVLGGGVSNIDAIHAALPERMAPFVFSDFVTTRSLESCA